MVNQIYTAKSRMYTVKNVYCKKKLSWAKYILKKVASVGKIYIIKM